MKRVLVLAAATAIAAAIPLSGQNGSGLDAGGLKGIELRSLGPALATGRIQDIEIDPKNPNIWYVATAFGGCGKRSTAASPSRRSSTAGLVHALLRRRRSEELERRLARDRRERQPAQRALRRRRLQVDRRRQDLDSAWGSRRPSTSARSSIDPRNSTSSTSRRRGRCGPPAASAASTRRPTAAATWDAVLTVSDDTGISDIVFDPKNPDVLYASSYQRRRAVGQMIGGGPEGGICKSTDAGKTWTKLTKGLPKDDVGRIALGVDPQESRHASTRSISAKAPRGRGGFGGRRRRTRRAGPVRRRGRLLSSDDAGPSGRGSAERCRAGSGRRDGGAGGAEAAVVRRVGAGARRRGAGCGPADSDGRLVSRRRRGLLPGDLRRSASARHDLVGQHESRLEQGRRQDLAQTGLREARPACTSIITSSRFDPSDANHILIGNDGGVYETYDRGRDVPVLRQPAGDAVLPRVDRQREAVLPRLRRRAGQLVALRPVASAEPLGHAHQRLVHRRRRRRLPDAQRSRGSEHRLRDVAGRQRHAARSAHRAVASIRPSLAARRRVPMKAEPRASRGGRSASAPRRVQRVPSRRAPQARRAALRVRARVAAGCAGAAGAQGGGRARKARRDAADAAWRPAGTPIGRTGTRPTSSARTIRGGCTGRASSSIAATIAATTGRAISPDLSRNLKWQELPIMGKVWPADSVALPRVHDRAEQRRVARRVAAARRTDLRRDRRRAAAGDRGRRQELAQGRPVPRRAASAPTCPTCSPRRATRTRCSSRSTTGSAATTSRIS